MLLQFLCLCFDSRPASAVDRRVGAGAGAGREGVQGGRGAGEVSVVSHRASNWIQHTIN